MNINVGLQYGAHPPKIAQSIKCTLPEAQVIFDRYHNELYPNVTKYREDYVKPFALANGYSSIGLGCRLYTDDANKDERTLVNSHSQFWSILTLLAINKLHQLIDSNNLQADIIVTATVYDSLYGEVTADPTVIAWLNNTIVDIMLTDFMHNQIVHNEANLEIGTNWADLHSLPNNASIEAIQTTLDSL